MSGLARRAALLFAALAIAAPLPLFLAPARAHACVCIQRDEQQATDAATAVFMGDLEDIQQAPTPYSRTLTFHVSGVNKGDVQRTQAVVTEEVMCGPLEVQVGGLYAVYAAGKPGVLRLNGCSLVIPMSGKSGTVRQHTLGSGTPLQAEFRPLESAEDGPDPGAVALVLVLPVLASLAVVAAGRRT